MNRLMLDEIIALVAASLAAMFFTIPVESTVMFHVLQKRLTILFRVLQ